jgi:hypothetical protein
MSDKALGENQSIDTRPTNEPCVMGYLVACPHMMVSRVLPTGEHHACLHWPRCERSVFVPRIPEKAPAP